MSSDGVEQMYRLDLHDSSAEDWLAQAERFDRMADRLQTRPQLSARFRQLALEARKRVRDRQAEVLDPSGCIEESDATARAQR